MDRHHKLHNKQRCESLLIEHISARNISGINPEPMTHMHKEAREFGEWLGNYPAQCLFSKKAQLRNYGLNGLITMIKNRQFDDKLTVLQLGCKLLASSPSVGLMDADPDLVILNLELVKSVIPLCDDVAAVEARPLVRPLVPPLVALASDTIQGVREAAVHCVKWVYHRNNMMADVIVAYLLRPCDTSRGNAAVAGPASAVCQMLLAKSTILVALLESTEGCDPKKVVGLDVDKVVTRIALPCIEVPGSTPDVLNGGIKLLTTLYVSQGQSIRRYIQDVKPKIKAHIEHCFEDMEQKQAIDLKLREVRALQNTLSKHHRSSDSNGSTRKSAIDALSPRSSNASPPPEIGGRNLSSSSHGSFAEEAGTKHGITGRSSASSSALAWAQTDSQRSARGWRPMTPDAYSHCGDEGTGGVPIVHPTTSSIHISTSTPDLKAIPSTREYRAMRLANHRPAMARPMSPSVSSEVYVGSNDIPLGQQARYAVPFKDHELRKQSSPIRSVTASPVSWGGSEEGSDVESAYSSCGEYSILSHHRHAPDPYGNNRTAAHHYHHGIARTPKRTHNGSTSSAYPTKKVSEAYASPHPHSRTTSPAPSNGNHQPRTYKRSAHQYRSGSVDSTSELSEDYLRGSASPTPSTHSYYSSHSSRSPAPALRQRRAYSPSATPSVQQSTPAPPPPPVPSTLPHATSSNSMYSSLGRPHSPTSATREITKRAAEPILQPGTAYVTDQNGTPTRLMVVHYHSDDEEKPSTVLTPLLQQQQQQHTEKERIKQPNAEIASPDMIKKLSHVQEKAEMLQRECEKMRKNLVEQEGTHTNEKRKQQETIADLQAKVVDLQNKNDNLSIKVRNQKKEENQTKNESKELQDKLRKIESEVETMRQDIRKLRQDNQHLKKEKETLQEQLNRVSKNHESRKNELQQENEQLKENLAVLQNNVGDTKKYQREVEKLACENEKLQQQTTAITEKYDDMCSELQLMSRARDRVVELEEELVNMKQNNSVLYDHNQKLSSSRSHSGELRELQQTVAHLENANAQLELDVEKRKTQYDTLMHQLEESLKDKEDGVQNVAQLQQAMIQKDDSNKQKLQSKEEEIVVLQEQLTKLSQLHAAHAEGAHAAATLQVQLQREREQRESLEKDLQDTIFQQNETVQQLHDDLVGSKQALNEKNKELQEMMEAAERVNMRELANKGVDKLKLQDDPAELKKIQRERELNEKIAELKQVNADYREQVQRLSQNCNAHKRAKDEAEEAREEACRLLREQTKKNAVVEKKLLTKKAAPAAVHSHELGADQLLLSCLSHVQKMSSFKFSRRLGKTTTGLIEGCEAAVFLAYLKDKFTDVPLVVKVMFNSETSIASNILRQFGNEFRILRDILPPSPFIVPLMSYFTDELKKGVLPDFDVRFHNETGGVLRHQTLFIVFPKMDCSLMNYLDGWRLRHQHYPVPAKFAMWTILQIACGIQVMNSTGVAHRDLKEDNILVNILPDESLEEGKAPKTNCICLNGEEDYDVEPVSSSPFRVQVCITDFGHASDQLRIAFPHQMIDKGGARFFMAPEIANCNPGRDVNLDYSKTDIFALGIMGYQLCAKFPYQTPSRMKANHVGDLHIPYEEYSYHLEVIIQRMLDPNPHTRCDLEWIIFEIGMLIWGPCPDTIHQIMSPTPRYPADVQSEEERRVYDTEQALDRCRQWLQHQRLILSQGKCVITTHLEKHLRQQFLDSASAQSLYNSLCQRIELERNAHIEYTQQPMGMHNTQQQQQQQQTHSKQASKRTPPTPSSNGSGTSIHTPQPQTVTPTKKLSYCTPPTPLTPTTPNSGSSQYGNPVSPHTHHPHHPHQQPQITTVQIPTTATTKPLTTHVQHISIPSTPTSATGDNSSSTNTGTPQKHIGGHVLSPGGQHGHHGHMVQTTQQFTPTPHFVGIPAPTVPAPPTVSGYQYEHHHGGGGQTAQTPYEFTTSKGGAAHVVSPIHHVTVQDYGQRQTPPTHVFGHTVSHTHHNSGPMAFLTTENYY